MQHAGAHVIKPKHLALEFQLFVQICSTAVARAEAEKMELQAKAREQKAKCLSGILKLSQSKTIAGRIEVFVCLAYDRECQVRTFLVVKTRTPAARTTSC